MSDPDQTPSAALATAIEEALRLADEAGAIDVACQLAAGRDTLLGQPWSGKDLDTLLPDAPEDSPPSG